MKKNKLHDYCFICNTPLSYYLSGKDFLYKTTTKVFKIYKCCNCGVEIILPRLTNEEISKSYPNNYYSYNYKSQKNIFIKLREKLIDKSYNKKTKKDYLYFLSYLTKFFLEGIPLKIFGERNFLDVGCGDGYNLDILSRYGWKTTGFEIGRRGIRNKIIYNSDITKVNFNEKFDYIRIWHVLEHVPNPDEFIEKIFSVLNKNGLAVFGLPNTDSFYAKIFRSYWSGRDIPRHLINYSLKNLMVLFDKHNFTVVKIKHLSAGGFLGSLQHLLLDKLGIHLKNHRILFFVFYPLDIICNLLKQGDAISVTLTNNEKS